MKVYLEGQRSHQQAEGASSVRERSGPWEIRVTSRCQYHCGHDLNRFTNRGGRRFFFLRGTPCGSESIQKWFALPRKTMQAGYHYWVPDRTKRPYGIKYSNLCLQCHIYCESILIHEQTASSTASSSPLFSIHSGVSCLHYVFTLDR